MTAISEASIGSPTAVASRCADGAAEMRLVHSTAARGWPIAYGCLVYGPFRRHLEPFAASCPKADLCLWTRGTVGTGS